MTPDSIITIVVTISGLNLMALAVVIFRIGTFTGKQTAEMSSMNRTLTEVKSTLALQQNQQIEMVRIEMTLQELKRDVGVMRKRSHKMAQRMTGLVGIMSQIPGPMVRKALESLFADTEDEAVEGGEPI